MYLCTMQLAGSFGRILKLVGYLSTLEPTLGGGARGAAAPLLFEVNKGKYFMFVKFQKNFINQKIFRAPNFKILTWTGPCIVTT